MSAARRRYWRPTLALAIFATAATLAWGATPSAQGPLLAKNSVDASVFRGGLVFANYCVTCHGVNADGNGRAARLYDPRPSNLRMSEKNDAYIGLIVQRGGEALGRSPKMPPWGEELTDEQVRDVVSFVRSVNVAPR